MYTLEGKNVAVTGGAGFLGSHVVSRLLTRGCNVTVIDDFSNGKMAHLEAITHHLELKIVRGDITKPADVRVAFAGCQVVIHLAVLCLRESIKHPHRVNEVIVDGTINCLEVARDQKIDLFLNCSSSEVYGTAEYVPIDELHPLGPETPYAAAKVAQDMYVRSYGATYGLPWVTIRPFNMYGPSSHWQGHRGEVIPKMIVRAMSGAPLVIFGDGNQTRDFLFVEDAANALVKIVETPQCWGQCINFATGKETSMRTIAELICANFKLDADVTIKHQTARPGDVRQHLGDNTKSKLLLGMEPQIEIEAGLAKTIDWFRALPFTAEELIAEERLRNWE